jgi:cytoskeletal protein CcmA (bactofilin family)
MAWRPFGSKEDMPDPQDWSGFLDGAVRFEGTLEVSGTFRLDANVKGTVRSSDVLILGEKCQMEGGVHGNRVIIAGRFDGVIIASGRVEVRPTGVVTGEIQTPCLVIEPGGVFDGRCHMLGPGEPNESAEPLTIPIRAAD